MIAGNFGSFMDMQHAVHENAAAMLVSVSGVAVRSTRAGSGMGFAPERGSAQRSRNQ